MEGREIALVVVGSSLVSVIGRKGRTATMQDDDAATAAIVLLVFVASSPNPIPPAAADASVEKTTEQNQAGKLKGRKKKKEKNLPLTFLQVLGWGRRINSDLLLELKKMQETNYYRSF